jgi:hypothetical protein
MRITTNDRIDAPDFVTAHPLTPNAVLSRRAGADWQIEKAEVARSA